MAFIEWTEKNEVGIRQVDEQHRELFALLNRLHAATVEGQEQSMLVGILNELVDYTVYHFDVEEGLMTKHEYPDYDAHKAEHDKLTTQAVDLQRQFQDGSATISFELLDFLHDWLMDHTMDTDRKMGAFMQDAM